MGYSKLLIILALGLTVSACDKQIQDFVERAVPKKKEEAQNKSAVGIKISPGRMEATATDMAIEANITPTQQLMQSADISAQISVGRTRVSQ